MQVRTCIMKKKKSLQFLKIDNLRKSFFFPKSISIEDNDDKPQGSSQPHQSSANSHLTVLLLTLPSPSVQIQPHVFLSNCIMTSSEYFRSSTRYYQRFFVFFNERHWFYFRFFFVWVFIFITCSTCSFSSVQLVLVFTTM